jgi:hypothetical protein
MHTLSSIFNVGDLPLASKIQEELVYEQEAAAKDTTSRAFLEHFIEEGIWKVIGQYTHCPLNSSFTPLLHL